MERTLKKILSVVLCVAVLATSVFCMGFVSAETNVNYLVQNGKRIGIKDVTIDGVTYYDIDGGRSTIDPDTISEIDLYKKALTAQYGGRSAMQMWANIASLVYENAVPFAGGLVAAGYGFDEVCAKDGGYGFDIIKDFSSGEKYSESYKFNKLQVKNMSTGLGYASSLNEAQDVMVKQIIDFWVEGMNTDISSSDPESVSLFKEIVTGNENGLASLNNTEETTVIYNILSSSVDSYYFSSYGIAFYDFEVVPIIDEELEYVTAADGYDDLKDASADVSGVIYSDSVDSVHTSYINNPSASESSVAVTYSETSSASVSNSIESSESYSFGTSKDTSTEISVNIKNIASISGSVSNGITTEEVLSTSFSKETVETKETTTETSAEVTLPAHTRLGISQQTGATKLALDYDCPVYLTYKVAIFSMTCSRMLNLSGSFSTTFGTDNTIGGLNAVDNLYNRAIQFKDTNGYETSQGNSEGGYGYYSDDNSPTYFTKINWNDFINTTQTNGTASARECVMQLKNHIPLSAAGATLSIDGTNMTTDISGIYPLYNLDSVKLVDDAVYNLEAGNSLDLGRIATAGYNAYNVPYYGYVSDGGEWVLCDENGNELASADGASLSNISGTQIFNTEKEGTYYLKFLIDENLYTDVDDDDVTIKNADLSSAPVIMVKVTQAADGSHKCVAGDWKTSFPATCSAEGEKCNYCVTCGKLMEVQAVAKLAHTEVETVTPATCQSEGSAKTVCGTCSTVISSRVIPKTEHTLGVWAVVSNATCTANGEKQQCCSSCGNVINSEVIPAHGHTDGGWKLDFEATADHNGQMSRYCTTCNAALETKEIYAHEHEQGYESIIRPATCTENGEKGIFCSICNEMFAIEQIEKKGHGENIAVKSILPTCTTAGEEKLYCADCGMLTGTNEIPAKGHGETYEAVASEATADRNGIIETRCKDCDAVISTEEFELHAHELGYESITREPTCTQKGEKGLFCKVCNAMYATEQIEKNGHGENIAVKSILPTCTTAGEEKLYCADCGMLTGANEIPAKGHGETYEAVASEATADRNGIIETRCKDCDAVISTEEFELHAHEPGYESITREPTCTQKGEKGLFCKVCNAMYATEQIEKNGHGENIAATSIQPTCTTAGEEKLYCADCGALTGTNEIPSLGHDNGVWTVSIKATCEDKGEEICRCTRCGETIETKTVDSLGHDNGVWKIDFEATADHAGQMTKYCTRCDVALESKTFELHTHSEGYRKVVTPATCTTEGEGGIFCASCGVQYGSYTVDSLGHDYSAWYKNSNGTHSRSCSRCRNAETNNCSYTSTVTAPTCTESGITTHVCDVCTYSYTETSAAALGHKWSSCTACDDGKNHSRICETCKVEETAAHNWGEWVSNGDSTATENGTQTRECADCGATETQEDDNTSWISEVFRPIIVFFGNIIHKLIYVVSLNWLFPELTIAA